MIGNKMLESVRFPASHKSLLSFLIYFFVRLASNNPPKILQICHSSHLSLACIHTLNTVRIMEIIKFLMHIDTFFCHTRCRWALSMTYFVFLLASIRVLRSSSIATPLGAPELPVNPSSEWLSSSYSSSKFYCLILPPEWRPSKLIKDRISLILKLV
jgi:hypothetical protein